VCRAAWWRLRRLSPLLRRTFLWSLRNRRRLLSWVVVLSTVLVLLSVSLFPPPVEGGNLRHLLWAALLWTDIVFWFAMLVAAGNRQ
jgi:hypothetical protein